MKLIRTKRLILRQWYLSDADDLFAYSQDHRVGPSAGWRPHQSRKDSENLIRFHFQRVMFHWAMVLPGEGRVIGGINLTQDVKRTYSLARMLGYSMNPDYWGNGYMTEAAQGVLEYGFKELNCGLISVYHYPGNERSRGVIQRCGFQYEGLLRQCSELYDGRILDNYCYSLTADEYATLGGQDHGQGQG